MLSTSFIVARQPARSKQESFSRNSVNTPNTAIYGQENAGNWIGRGSETVSQTREGRQAKTDRDVNKTRDTSQPRETSIKKLGRSMSMSKSKDTISLSNAKTGRSVSQTRDPQQVMSHPTWETNCKEIRNDRFRNPTISENVEGATKFGYSYISSLYGTMGGDASSIYAIQSRPLPEPKTEEVEKGPEEKSLYQNIER